MPRLAPRHTGSPGRRANVVAYLAAYTAFRIVPRFGIETGIYSYSGHSVKNFDGMADFQ